MSAIFKHAGYYLLHKKLIVLIAVFCAVFFCADVFAQKNWTGNSNNQWNVASNWAPAGVPVTGDAVQIGVVSFGTNPSPVLSSSATVASITFGQNVALKSLTVNGATSTLTVSGDIVHQHSQVSVLNGLLGTSLLGTGRILCNGNLQTGTPIPNITILGLLGFENTTRIQSTINQLEIKGNLNIVTSETPLLSIIGIQLGIAKNNALFSLEGGTLILTNQIITSNYLSPALLGSPAATTTSRYQINAANNTSALLQLQNANALQINNPATYYENNSSVLKGNSVDFYVPVAGTGVATVEYTGTAAQTVYTSSSTQGLDNIGKSITGTTVFLQAYQNIKFSGAGQKNIQGGYLLIAGTWLSGNGKINATDNSTIVYFSGNSGQQTINDTGSDNGKGVLWRYAIFDNDNIGLDVKTIQSGNFFIVPNGTVSVTGLGSLNVDNTGGGTFTLQSNATSSATVLPIPSGSSITGNVNVERYVSGGDISKRGYRLISSPVNVNVNGVLNNSTATAITTPWYITNKAFVSGPGGTGNGFDAAQRNNPTLYLYREDVAYSNASFTAGNFKAVEKIDRTATPATSLTVTGITPGTASSVSVPAGNAYFFYFAGDRVTNLANKGSVAVVPEQVTFAATGTLNQGSVPVKLWFGSAIGLSFASPTANIKGFALVGNPYASTIDWSKFSSTLNTAGIYGPGVSGTIYQLNLNSKSYSTYISSAAPTTNGGSGYIPSGQGFFVKATAANATLTFNEAAKTTTQQSPLVFMGLPAHTDSPGEWLKLALVRDSLNSDEIALWFRPDSKTSLDSLDADDLGGQGNLVSLSSLSDEKSRFLAVNALPYPENSSTIALGLSASASGLYTLQRTELKDVPPLYDIWLKDLLMKDSLDLRQNKTYSFRIDRNKAETFGNGRFQIIIRKKSIPPYELISFTAERTANGNTLTWKVLNEAGYTGFVIERIGGNKQYIPLYEIQSDGKGTYSYTDQNPVPGSNFYRLKQDDINNKIAYSQTIEIKENTHNKAFSIYPNPTSDWLNINMDKKAKYMVRVTDTKGKQIKTIFFNGQTAYINVAALSQGVYFLEIRDEQSFKIAGINKFIKL